MGTIHQAELSWAETERGDRHFRRKQLGGATDDEQLGCSLYEIPPGRRGWPYHYHTANAEAIYVLDGKGELRGPDDDRNRLNQGLCCPTDRTRRCTRGRKHRRGAAPVSRRVDDGRAEVLRYPDSDKVGVMAGQPPGGDSDERLLSAYFRRTDAVDYWSDEN
jgi:uncharacterized cupin superfamily protein